MYEEYVTITLSNEDAALFAKFRKFQAVFEQLEREGVANMRNGSVTLHYDKNGQIRNVQVLRNYFR